MQKKAKHMRGEVRGQVNTMVEDLRGQDNGGKKQKAATKAIVK